MKLQKRLLIAAMIVWNLFMFHIGMMLPTEQQRAQAEAMERLWEQTQTSAAVSCEPADFR